MKKSSPIWAWMPGRRILYLIALPLIFFGYKTIVGFLAYLPIHLHKPYCWTSDNVVGETIYYSPDLDPEYRTQFIKKLIRNDIKFINRGDRVYTQGYDFLNSMNRSVRQIAFKGKDLLPDFRYPPPKPDDLTAYKLYYDFEMASGSPLTDDNKIIAWCKLVEYVTQKKKPPPFKLKPYEIK